MKKVIVILFAILWTMSVMGQTENDKVVIKELLKTAKSLFYNKQYTEALNALNLGISQYGYKNDSLYVELLHWKYLSISFKDGNREALPFCKEAIKVYKGLGRYDGLMYYICRDYCIIDHNPFREEFDKFMFHECARCIIKTRYFKDKDFELYRNALKYNYCSLKERALLDSLAKEELFVKSVDNLLLLSNFCYAKGWLLANEHPRYGLTFNASLKRKNMAVQEFKKGLELLKGMGESVDDELLFDFHIELAELYSELNHPNLAAFQYKNAIDLNIKKLDSWGVKDSLVWMNYYPSKLIESRQYSAMIDFYKYVNDNLTSLRFGEYSKHLFLNYYNEALRSINKNEDTIRTIIDNSIDLDDMTEISDRLIYYYKKGHLSKHFFDSILHTEENEEWWMFQYPLKPFYDFLLEQRDYVSLLMVTEEVINHYLSIMLESGENLVHNDLISGKCSQYDFDIDRYRTEWHNGNVAETFVQSFTYHALAAFRMGDYTKAIKYQRIAVDIYRTDWQYNVNQRHRYLEESLLHGYNINAIYLNRELSSYLLMADLYLQTNDYKNAYGFYRKLLDLTWQMIENAISYGSKDIKEEAWHDYNWPIYETMRALTDFAAQYPPFADLLFECNSLLKGFLLNIHEETFSRAQNNGDAIKRKYAELQQLKRRREYSFYGLEISQKEIECIGEISLQLDAFLGVQEIVRNAKDNLSMIEDKIKSNEVLVDFFIVSSNELIEKESNHQLSCSKSDSIEVSWDIWKVTEYDDPIFFALIIRKEWQHPKIVRIGKLSQISIEGKDYLDLLYYQEKYERDINKLYRNSDFAFFIWDKILSVGNIKKNEHIFFCPASYLHDIAIEHLLYDDQIMSDLFKIDRISTIRELNKEKSQYSKQDKCVAYGDIMYSPLLHSARKTKYKIGDGRLASNPQNIYNRHGLDNLSGETRGMLKTIKKYFPEVSVLTGHQASEQSFMNMSGSSPEVLFIATHGYNFEREDLSDGDTAYLYGNRDESFFPDAEKGMYHSGLYMAQSGSPTDGMLSAKEISLCDFHNTKLAIIAACVSGVGKITDEGVYGLQRGLKMAGVQTLLVSLWEVDAKATELLMSEFLRFYTKGIEKHDALKSAQKNVMEYRPNDPLRDYQPYKSPYYWAGFVLID